MKKIKLGDIATFKNGINFSKNESTHVYKCIGVTDFQKTILDNFNNASTISIDQNLTQEYFLRNNDIVLVRSNGNKQLIGRSMLVFPNSDIVTYSGFCIRCRVMNDSADVKYIFYSLQNALKQGLFAINQQTNINNINQTVLSNLEFYVPPIDTQRRIGNFLYALDKKIALNKKINATLEAMAKTLYDYWFVQFDFPDENGKPYKTSGGKMIYNSELGRDIPVGWEVKTLGELLTENTTLFNQQTIEPTIDLSVMPSSSIALDELSSSEMFSTNLFKMKEGDILFGSIRPYLKKAGIAPCNGVVVGTIHSYQVKKEFDYTFALFTVCRDKFFDYAVKVSTGTRMPIIKSENLLSYKIAYSKSVVKLFNIQNLKQIICKNVQESHRLAALRDWLLPMLMNEQIKFKET